MGTSCAPDIANLYLAYFELKVQFLIIFHFLKNLAISALDPKNNLSVVHCQLSVVQYQKQQHHQHQVKFQVMRDYLE